MREIRKLVRQLNTEHKQDDIKLKRTTACVQMWRDARANGLAYELIVEIELLIGAMAIDEWGEGTTYDDFQIEGKIIIENGNRRVIL